MINKNKRTFFQLCYVIYNFYFLLFQSNQIHIYQNKQNYFMKQSYYSRPNICQHVHYHYHYNKNLLRKQSRHQLGQNYQNVKQRNMNGQHYRQPNYVIFKRKERCMHDQNLNRQRFYQSNSQNWKKNISPRESEGINLNKFYQLGDVNTNLTQSVLFDQLVQRKREEQIFNESDGLNRQIKNIKIKIKPELRQQINEEIKLHQNYLQSLNSSNLRLKYLRNLRVQTQSNEIQVPKIYLMRGQSTFIKGESDLENDYAKEISFNRLSSKSGFFNSKQFNNTARTNFQSTCGSDFERTSRMAIKKVKNMDNFEDQSHYQQYWSSNFEYRYNLLRQECTYLRENLINQIRKNSKNGL